MTKRASRDITFMHLLRKYAGASNIFRVGRLSLPGTFRQAPPEEQHAELLRRGREFIPESQIERALIEFGIQRAEKSLTVIDPRREIVRALSPEGEEVLASPNPFQKEGMYYIPPNALIPDLKRVDTQQPAWIKADPPPAPVMPDPPPAPFLAGDVLTPAASTDPASTAGPPAGAASALAVTDAYVPPPDLSALAQAQAREAPAPLAPSTTPSSGPGGAPPTAPAVTPAPVAPSPPGVKEVLAPTSPMYRVKLPEEPAPRPTRRMRIGDALVELGFGEVEPYEMVDPKLDQKLVAAGRITGEQGLKAQALMRHMQFVDVKINPPNPAISHLLDEQTCKNQRVFPYDLLEDGTFQVLTDTPQRELVIRTVVAERSTRPQVELLVTGTPALDQLIREQYTSGTIMRELHEEFGVDDAAESTLEESNPVQRFLQETILEAIARDASDIHIEPMSTGLQIRFRIDGALTPAMKDMVSKSGIGNVVRVLKLMSNMDVGNTRTPQDNRLNLKVGGRHVNLRVSSMPQNSGQEKMVLRLLKEARDIPEIEKLGMTQETLERFQQVIRRPEGLFLVTGPTGSGKSFTLYSLLKRIATPERNTQTLEDPIEYHIPGLNQSQVNEGAGYTFEAGLRAAMRQDPDVLLLGEIRDTVTARISLSMANTGHQVLSTLHTINAASAVQRLRDLGVPNYNITPSLQGVMAQRLVRRLCPHCSVPAPLPERVRRTLERAGVAFTDQHRRVHPEGCARCERGRKGRMPIHELLVVNDEIREIINQGAPASEIQAAARREGMLSLMIDGYLKVAAGHLAVEDLEDALNETAEDTLPSPPINPPAAEEVRS